MKKKKKQACMHGKFLRISFLLFRFDARCFVGIVYRIMVDGTGWRFFLGRGLRFSGSGHLWAFWGRRLALRVWVEVCVCVNFGMGVLRES